MLDVSNSAAGRGRGNATRSSRLNRSLLLSVLVVASLAATPVAATAAGPDCTAAPLPTGCITTIQYVDPSSFAMSQAGDAVAVSYSADAPSTFEQLPAAEPLEQAAAHAGSEALARGYAIRGSTTAKAAGLGHRRGARAAGYSAYCTGLAYTPHIVSMGGNYYHMHAKSEQTCNGMTSHFIYTNLYRDNVNRAGDSAQGTSGQQITTDAWISCYDLGDVHTWWNWSSFYGYVGSTLIQGPEGFFTYADHHCT